MTSHKRFFLSVEVAGWLYFVAASAGLGYWAITKEVSLPLFNGLVAMPALAALGLVASALLFPSLLVGEKVRWPLPVTLPAVFCSFQFVLTHLVVQTQSELAVIPEPLRGALYWKRPTVVLAAFLAQVLFLMVWAKLSAMKQQRKPNPQL